MSGNKHTPIQTLASTTSSILNISAILCVEKILQIFECNKDDDVQLMQTLRNRPDN